MTNAEHILTELQKNNIKTEEGKVDEDEAILSSNDESLNVKGWSFKQMFTSSRWYLLRMNSW